MPEWKEVQEITGETLRGYHGGVVDIDGNYAIVGNHSESPAGSPVIWYQRDKTMTWVEIFRDVKDDNLHFGKSVAISGSYAVVGGRLGGKVYWYQRDNKSNWKEIQVTEGEDNEYGTSVDISGNYAIVGGSYAEEEAVFFYERQKNLRWELVGTHSFESQYDGLGNSVSISGNYAIVGAHRWLNDTGPGKVYFFERKKNVKWEMIYSHEGEIDNDRFGDDVYISGNNAIVSAINYDSNRGKVYFFQKDGGENWKLVDTKEGENENDRYGQSVSISGNFAYVGARGFESNSGKIYFYQKKKNLKWDLVKTFTSDTASGNMFGDSGSISGGYAIVGEPQSDIPLSTVGSVKFYAYEV